MNLLLPCVQVKEACALSLGYLSVGEPCFPHRKVVLESLFSTREDKGMDLQFTIGEAIACAAAGPLCSLATPLWGGEYPQSSR